MPKRTDISSILIIGSGPIVIGQGCEFDYSGVQACRALREEGFRVVLINSNPATIMTDPEFADATYIEPIAPETIEKILRREKEQGTPIDALLPTLGGQTGLNTGMACFDQGILTKYGVQMIGADREAIFKGEDRQVFKDLMISIGLKVPLSKVVHTFDEARAALDDVGLPAIIRPAFTLGGTGGGIAYNHEEFETIVRRGLDASPVGEVLIEQSVIGWKEFEMEVVRDKNDNAIIICSIENLDAMGVHTGDSITVAPIQTLTDKEYQRMRDASLAVIRAVGVETGGSNIQFGINPANGEMVVIEMNPRVSRSSALASKATGYPIAKIAAKLAVGYTLDELPNPITTRKRPKADRAAPDHDRAARDKHPAAPDHDRAAPDHDRAAPDHDRAAPDHDRAARDKHPAAPDHDRAAPDHDRAARDKHPAAPDHDRAAPDHDRAARDKHPAAPDHDRAAPNTERVASAMHEGGPSRDDYELYTSACFEPTIDYCVIKIPRFTFEKFPDADPVLTTQMKSVGEAMAIGRTFKEALQKGIRSMEIKRFGFGLDGQDLWLKAEGQGTGDKGQDHASSSLVPRSLSLVPPSWPIPDDVLRARLAVPTSERLWYVRYALKMGWSIDQVHQLTKYDPWFIGQMQELVAFEEELLPVREWNVEYERMRREGICNDHVHHPHELRLLKEAKRLGYSDVQLQFLLNAPVREMRHFMDRRFGGLKPVYKLVDTCAAEFEAATPYYYSTYERRRRRARMAPQQPRTKSASPTSKKSSSSAAARTGSGRA